MKAAVANPSRAKGSSLIEAVIAVGVLAVAVPLVFGTMAQSGEASLSSQAETRSSWIVATCLDELQYAMRGESETLDKLTPGKAFPSRGVTSLAFTTEGRTIGKISQRDYQKGVQVIARQSVRYIASMSGELPAAAAPGTTPVLDIKVTVEYPASAPVEKRRKLEFHTRLP